MEYTKDKKKHGEGLIYEVNGVEGEKTINSFMFQYGMHQGNIKVLVTEQPKDSNGEEFFNIYILDDSFKIEPMNNLFLQEPKESIKNPTKYFNKMRLEMFALQHYLWRNYSTNKKTLSFNVEVNED